MALYTSNVYGKITVSEEAVLMAIKKIAMDCYGIAELVSRRLSDSVMLLFRKDPIGRGIHIVTEDSRIYIDIYCLIASGVNADAVSESLRSALIYHIENFTGMRVKSVEVHVMGMKL